MQEIDATKQSQAETQVMEYAAQDLALYSTFVTLNTQFFARHPTAVYQQVIKNPVSRC